MELFVPPKHARTEKNRGRELEIKPADSAAVRSWKQRMAEEGGKQIYKERAATSETVNADLRTYRGLAQLTVRGLAKTRCVALWCALAYNLLHFAAAPRQLIAGCNPKSFAHKYAQKNHPASTMPDGARSRTLRSSLKFE